MQEEVISGKAKLKEVDDILAGDVNVGEENHDDVHIGGQVHDDVSVGSEVHDDVSSDDSERITSTMIIIWKYLLRMTLMSMLILRKMKLII